MKKLFTLIAAVALFATAAMAETITVSGHKVSEIKSTSYDLTQAQLTTIYGTFYFTIDGANGFVANQQYTYDDFSADYTFLDYQDAGTTYYAIESGSTITKIDDDNWTATAVCEDGNTYIITIAPLVPITDPTDTVIINMDSRANNRLTDVVADQGVFQLVGYDANAEYALYFAIQNATAIAGTYSEDDIYTDYTALYQFFSDGTYATIELNNLLGDVTVYEINYHYSATINWVGTDSTLYIINYEYSDPTAATQATVSGTFEAEEDAYYDVYETYYGLYVYDITITGTEYTMYAVTYNENSDDVYGTWDVADGYVEISFVDNTTEVEYEAFSGSVTITGTATTGSVLAYGDIQFTVQADGTAVENAEVSEYNAYTEGNTIVLNGAEGENAAIYDVAGRLISNGMVTSNAARFEVAASGVYMVRVNGQTLRVVVK